MAEIEVVDKEIRIKSMGLTRSRIVVLGENGRLYWRHIEDLHARWTLIPPLVITLPNDQRPET